MTKCIAKMFLVFLVLSLIFCFTLSANNLQKTYTVNDDIYKRVDRLTREAGVIGPSSFSPMSGKVLEIALQRIDTSKLSQTQLEEYNDLYNEIVNDEEINTIFYSDNFGLDLGMGANLAFNFEDYEKFSFSNQKIDRRNDNMIPYRYLDGFASIYPKIYFGDYIFLEGKFELRNNDWRNYESSLGWLLTNAEGKIRFFGLGYPNALAPEIPYKAGLSVGNDYIHFILGRYPHSIGSGITGNLMVGDNFLYQEISNLSLISNYFTYNISVTRFDQMNNIQESNPGFAEMSRSEFDGMQQFRVVHQFDVNLFNKVRFAVDLSTIYNSTYGFDLRFFYPFVIAHNYYNYTNELEKTPFDEANNMMTFSLEATPMKGLSIGAQFALDQAQTYFEDKTSVPSAWGVLANIKYTTSIKEHGNLDSWFEFVYTNPYIYLNGKIDPNTKLYDYNLDYIIGYRAHYVPEFGYSGYQYGPDTILFAFGSEYISNSNWTLGFKTIYRIQGLKRLGNKYDSNSESIYIDMSNSTIENDSSIYINNSTPTGGWNSAEHFLQPVVYGSYSFDYYNLKIYASIAFNTYFNYEFTKGKTEFLPQATIGIKWTGINTNWF